MIKISQKLSCDCYQLFKVVSDIWSDIIINNLQSGSNPPSRFCDLVQNYCLKYMYLMIIWHLSFCVHVLEYYGPSKSIIKTILLTIVNENGLNLDQKILMWPWHLTLRLILPQEQHSVAKECLMCSKVAIHYEVSANWYIGMVYSMLCWI